jgi:hypothetical protein
MGDTRGGDALLQGLRRDMAGETIEGLAGTAAGRARLGLLAAEVRERSEARRGRNVGREGGRE